MLADIGPITFRCIEVWITYSVTVHQLHTQGNFSKPICACVSITNQISSAGYAVLSYHQP